jgi:uncharacterized protein YjbJ (UPF0337 family)
MTSTQDTKEQARQAASTAADESKHVAGVAREEAQNVAGEAKEQVRGLLDEARGQVDEQTRSQRDRLVGTLHTFSGDLDNMASSGGSGLAAQLAQQVADRSRSLGNHLDGREPADILSDVRRFARQRPTVFLLGALGAGVVVGRLARGAKEAGSSTGSSTLSVPTDVTLSVEPQSSPAPTGEPPAMAAGSTPAGSEFPDGGGLGSQSAPPLDEQGLGSAPGTGPQGYLP